MKSKQLNLFEPNYIVKIGFKQFYANTEDEAWDIIGLSQFGQPYSVESPTGKCVHDFIPF